MRVLYFSRADTPHDRRFLAALAGSGHEIYSLRLERQAHAVELPPEVHPLEWPGISAPAGLEEALRLAPDLAEIVSRIQPDLIHAGPIQLCAALAARTGVRPLVAMSWGSDLLVEADQNAAWRAATVEALQNAEILVCDNRAVADKAIHLGFSPERIVRFPWGVDLRHFSPAPSSPMRKRLGWEDAFVLLCLRSWEPLYGVDVVARAFVRAAHERPAVRLLLPGSGSQGAAIRTILSEGGVLDRAAFPGVLPLADLPDVYRAADVYLSASHSDGSSVSLLEAMACAKPALVSDIPGNREWITHDKTGWTFPDGDDGALAEAILRAVDCPSQLAPMGQAARTLIERSADWERNFPRLLNAYEQTISSKRALRFGEDHA
ncbi:MAG TPA: glycosyltransferase [Anaerolineaceae bacterium]